MDEHGRARSRDVELALQRHLLLIAEERILRVVQQADRAEHAADDVDDHDGHISRDRRRVLQIADALVPDIVVAVKLIDLRGVLPAVEQIQPAERQMAADNAHELLSAKAHRDGEKLLNHQHQRDRHIRGDPPVRALDQHGVHDRPPVRNEAEHRREIHRQRRRGQHADPFLDIGVPPDPADHRVLQRAFQQKQREQIASHRDDVAQRVQRDKQVLQLISQRLREKEKIDDASGISALFGNENQDAGKLHHQAAAHAQQAQRFPVLLHQQHKNGRDKQQHDEHKQHGMIRLRFLLSDNVRLFLRKSSLNARTRLAEARARAACRRPPCAKRH